MFRPRAPLMLALVALALLASGCGRAAPGSMAGSAIVQIRQLPDEIDETPASTAPSAAPSATPSGPNGSVGSGR